MSRPIEDYAFLGDGETAALLGRDGSIDWLCWPRFDDAACFAALLGTPENGHWSMAPAEPVIRRSRRYQDDTLVMETEFETANGSVRIVDFMPIRKGASALVRIVLGLSGTVQMSCMLRLRFDYGALPPWSMASGDDMVARVGPDLVILRSGKIGRPCPRHFGGVRSESRRAARICAQLWRGARTAAGTDRREGCPCRHAELLAGLGFAV